jgi:uncharacterized nucleotidyltransferase DUF6036
MTRDQLEHAVRAACDLTHESEVIVVGSQAILGEYPNAPARLRQSMEIDLIVRNKPELADVIDGVLGEMSDFHRLHGFYAQGLAPDAAKLPVGWESRLVLVRNANTRDCSGWCLESHDLAAAKLAAFRDKDRDFVRTMLLESLIDEATLQERIATLSIDDEFRSRLAIWIAASVRDIRAARATTQ